MTYLMNRAGNILQYAFISTMAGSLHLPYRLYSHIRQWDLEEYS